MTPPKTIVGTLVRTRGLNRPWLRRALFLILILACLLLGFFPERYRAAVTVTPSDPSNLGFTSSITQLGALNSVFGNQAALEIALKVAGSVYVRETAAKELKLERRMGFKDRIQTHRWLERHVDIRALRGGIIQIQLLNRDPQLARDIISAYANATRDQLARINRQQTGQKREALIQLVGEASAKLAQAQGNYDRFRLSTRYSDPAVAVEAIGARIPILQQSIKAKEVQLNAARQFYTPDNIRIRQIEAELRALHAQLAQAQTTTPGRNDNVGRAVVASTQARKLERDLRFAQAIYDRYVAFLESTSAEDLTSRANVRVLEPPFIDTDRQLNYPPLAAALALLLLLLALEFYELRPPLGERIVVRETYA
ncbi:MAG: hypothetical protein ACJ8EY_10820 [Sphingomicrobium sp.]